MSLLERYLYIALGLEFKGLNPVGFSLWFVSISHAISIENLY